MWLSIPWKNSRIVAHRLNVPSNITSHLGAQRVSHQMEIIQFNAGIEHHSKHVCQSGAQLYGIKEIRINFLIIKIFLTVTQLLLLPHSQLPLDKKSPPAFASPAAMYCILFWPDMHLWRPAHWSPSAIRWGHECRVQSATEDWKQDFLLYRPLSLDERLHESQSYSY